MLCASAAHAITEIRSPDGNVKISFSLGGGTAAYRIDYLGKPLVLSSRLGFAPNFTNGFQVTKTASSRHRGEWTQVYGERRVVPDNYQELDVDLKHPSGRVMRLTFRAYDEGAALRYNFPKSESAATIAFTAEQTEFRFPSGVYGYEEHSTEGEYHRVPVADIQSQCERPLTLEYPDGRYACLAEADNENYPRMLLSGLPGSPGALVSTLGGATSNTLTGGTDDGSVTLAPGASTPWRLFVVGQKPGDLLERNYLLLNLNPPLAIKDTSWIAPGKAMRETTLTTTGGKAIIDFAVTAGLQYVLFDDHWYGKEDVETGDATTARAPNLDIAEVVKYGNEKSVGVILYVDRRQVEKQRNILFPLYEKWGVKGVKIGFVQVGSQEENDWITSTIQKAAEHHLMVNFHDGYRPTGYSRAYPNLMTVEGIRGNEHMPTPEHNCTLPFTRFVTGPADYTICYYTNRKQTTCAQQLALAVVCYSPLQMLFWYDKPSDYHGEPEIEFFRHVPTVWDETKVIDGRIGEYAAVARRSGSDWFLGAITNGQARTLSIPLKFLLKGRRYTAHLYADSDAAATRTHVSVATMPVDAGTVLQTSLSAGGGQAVWITPTTKE
ncbi:MAG: glycoside hydrolase family 97 protein [Capsulimonas sp.]|nr:glycoside hydrolase family 97 protein [Capsulimonas sp.]